MLAPISGTRRDGGSSFRALKNYLGFKKNKETGEMVCRSELLISESLLSEQTAQAEMRAVASENMRVKDPVYHYQLCWQEDEFPEKDQWKAAAEKSIRALGFGEHQYIIAPHNDTDHFHVHVMVNRVHPDTYRAHYPEFSKRSLDQAIREIEAEQGWKESKGLFRWDREQGRAIQNTREEMQAAERQETNAGDKRANKLETHTDTESLEAYAKARPAKEIAALMKSGRKVDWSEIHSVMAKHGLELERGDKSGYKVRAVGTELRVKASSVFRETFAGQENRARLEKLGGWELRAEIKPSRPTEVYKPRPVKRDPDERAERREQRADERKALKEAYRVYKSGLQADQKARADSIRVQLKQITVAYGQERAAIRGGESTKRPADRKAALSLAAMKVATNRAGLQGQLKDALAATVFMSYRDWVTDQAQRIGNSAAVGQLRGFAYSERRVAGKVPAVSIVIEPSEEPVRSTDYVYMKPQDLTYKVHRNGDVQYSQGKEALFIDQGSKISLLQQSEVAYVAALQLGQAKFGFRLHVTGTETERKAFALAAAKHGLRVEFTDDRMNAWMREASHSVKAAGAVEHILPAELEGLIQKTKAMYPEYAKEFLSRYADPAPRPVLSAEERWSATREAHKLADLRIKEVAMGKKTGSKYEQLVDFVVAKNKWEQGHRLQTMRKSQAWTELNDEHTRIFERHQALEQELAGLQAERKELEKLRSRSMPQYKEQEQADFEEERSRQSIAAEIDRHRPSFERRVHEHLDRLEIRQKERQLSLNSKDLSL